jgi:hypothetical protein
MKALRLLTLLFLALLLLVGCRGVPIGFRLDRSGDYVHIHSGMRFPRTVGSFVRVGAHPFDGAGYDVGVDYDLMVPFKVIITVFVYPSEGKTLEAGFERVVREIGEARKSVVERSRLEIQHRHGGKSFSSRSIVFTHIEREVVLYGIAHLFKYGSWFILYRITCEPQNQAETKELVEIFMKTLSWPEAS